MRISIRWRLILSIALPLLLVYGGVLTIAFRTLRASAYKNVESQMNELAAHQAARFDGELAAAAQVARAAADYLDSHPDVSEADLRALLESNLRRNALVYGSAVAFEPGTYTGRRVYCPYLCRTNASTAPSESNFKFIDLAQTYKPKQHYASGKWEWYSLPKKTKAAIWTEPYFDQGGGDVAMCTYSVPFFRRGDFWGIATIDVRLEDLQQKVTGADLAGGRFAITSRRGSFISHPDPKYILRRKTFDIAAKAGRDDLKELARRLSDGERGVVRLESYPTDEPNYVFFAPIATAGWSFSAAVPEREVLQPVWDQLRKFIAVMLAGLAVILAVLLFASIQITRPLNRLTAAVNELSAGNLDARVDGVAGNHELGDLARGFNKMTADLKSHVAALTSETAARRVVEAELRLAREIQASLLPRTFPPFPHRPEFDLHAVNLPANHIAGDFYDFFFTSPDVLTVVIADVSGKGVPAALFMAVTRTVLRNLAMTGRSPAQILREANAILGETNDRDLFVTIFLGQYETTTGRLRYANAAHPLPLRLNGKGIAEPCGEVSGTLVGIFHDDGDYFVEDREVQLSIGERLLLYTDGVPDGRSANGEFFGEDRLAQLFAEHQRESVEISCELTATAIADFQGRRLRDDVTLVMLRRNR